MDINIVEFMNFDLGKPPYVSMAVGWIYRKSMKCVECIFYLLRCICMKISQTFISVKCPYIYYVLFWLGMQYLLKLWGWHHWNRETTGVDQHLLVQSVIFSWTDMVKTAGKFSRAFLWNTSHEFPMNLHCTLPWVILMIERFIWIGSFIPLFIMDVITFPYCI